MSSEDEHELRIDDGSDDDSDTGADSEEEGVLRLIAALERKERRADKGEPSGESEEELGRGKRKRKVRKFTSSSDSEEESKRYRKKRSGEPTADL